MPTKVKLTDARVRDVYDTLANHQHVTNMEALGHIPQCIPDFEQTCTWLVEHLKTRKYIEIVFDCKRLIKMKKANAYQSALVQVAPAQMKEFSEDIPSRVWGCFETNREGLLLGMVY